MKKNIFEILLIISLILYTWLFGFWFFLVFLILIFLIPTPRNVVRVNVLGLNLCFVFRHKWDKPLKERKFDGEFRDYKLGLWYKPSKIVGCNDFNDPSKWGSNMVASHMIGINLIVCKLWLTIDYKGKHFGE